MQFTTDVVIGLEIHIQLATATKLFCACSTKEAKEPNTHTCPICLGMPGAKPVVNQKALDFAALLCRATNATLAPKVIFSRKSYFYPDMAKNYQITQYEEPLGENGMLRLPDGTKVRIKRIHVEEDPAALTHGAQALVDYNRSGNPLVELVTEPDLSSPSQARDFMKQIITLLRYLKIYDGGIIKADANISIKEKKYTRVEIKNITGFKEIERALLFEIERQKEEDVMQETRGWDADLGITKAQRKKETEEEYGYVLDPDLAPATISKEALEKELPELPFEKAQRFVKEYKLKEEDASILVQEYALGHLFERAVKVVTPALAVTWIRHETNRVLNYNKLSLEDVNLDEEQMLKLLQFVQEKKVTENAAKKILNKLIIEPFDVEEHIKKEGLETVSDTSQLEEICKAVIKKNPDALADYKKGNEKSLNFLVGQVMRQTKGAASPPELLEIIKGLIE